VALLRDGKLVYMVPRSAIETSTPPVIAQELVDAFNTSCSKPIA
jgi:putative YphP/YqiW family bacilliredoxin